MQGTLKSGLNGNDVRVKPKGSRVQIKPAKMGQNCHVPGKRKKKKGKKVGESCFPAEFPGFKFKYKYKWCQLETFVAYITTRLATFKSN